MLIKIAGFVTGMAAATLLSAAGFQSSVKTKAAVAPLTEVKVKEGKRDAVKLYPNPSFDGNVTVSSNKAEKIHFYIFQQDGTLQHQAILKEKQKHIIQHLKKGVYTYDAFVNDVSIEHGEITVK